MSDFTGVRIGAAIYRIAAGDHAPADARRQCHIKQRPVAAARAIESLAQRAHVGVIVHDRKHAQRFLKTAWQIEITPAADMRGQRDTLPFEFDRTTEANATAIDAMARLPTAGN